MHTLMVSVECAVRSNKVGFNMRPQPFECSIKPRSAEIAAIVRKEADAANEQLSIYEPC